jgi:hypothetical protein
MEHVRDLTYHTSADPSTFRYRISIQGRIDSGPELTAYLLKYGK